MMSRFLVLAIASFAQQGNVAVVDAFSSYNAAARRRPRSHGQSSLHAFEVVASEVSTIAQSAEMVAPMISTTTTLTADAAIAVATATSAAATGLPSSSTAAAATSGGLSTAINSFFQTQPYVAAFVTCSFKASAADMLAQTQEDKPQPQKEDSSSIPFTLADAEVDLSRNMGFLLYGGLYQGMVQNFLYSVVYPNLVGTGEGWDIVATKVLIDNLFFAPFLCLPIAYIFKTVFTSEESGINFSILNQSLGKYYYDVTNKGLLTKYWSLWVPVQFLTFGIIPEHFRVAFVAFISFFWICVLSTVVSSDSATTTSASNLDNDRVRSPF